MYGVLCTIYDVPFTMCYVSCLYTKEICAYLKSVKYLLIWKKCERIVYDSQMQMSIHIFTYTYTHAYTIIYDRILSYTIQYYRMLDGLYLVTSVLKD